MRQSCIAMKIEIELNIIWKLNERAPLHVSSFDFWYLKYYGCFSRVSVLLYIPWSCKFIGIFFGRDNFKIDFFPSTITPWGLIFVWIMKNVDVMMMSSTFLYEKYFHQKFQL